MLLEEADDSEDSDVPCTSTPSSSSISIRRRHIDPSELTPKQLERVMKNRQAAQASRERKRAYVTELEASRDRLQSEALELRVRVNVLEKEKSCLSNQVSQLKAEFEELKALFLSSKTQVTDSSMLVSHRGRSASSTGAEEEGEQVEEDEGCFRMTSRPVAIAINQPTETFSPSTKFSGQQHLERTRRASMPLPNRNHCQPAHILQNLPRHHRPSTYGGYPMTRSLLRSRNTCPPGYLHHRQKLASTQQKSYGLTSTRTKLPYQQIIRSQQSSTWATQGSRRRLSYLMTLLISKYQFK